MQHCSIRVACIAFTALHAVACTSDGHLSALLSCSNGLIGGDLDRTVLEVFFNDGRGSSTRVVYPVSTAEPARLEVFAYDGVATVQALEAWELQPIWPDSPSSHATLNRTHPHCETHPAHPPRRALRSHRALRAATRHPHRRL